MKRLFPQQCLFCGKQEVKVSGETEQCINFTVFKDKAGAVKDPSWKQVKPRVQELGLNDLHHMVQGEDLFTREARFHHSCRKAFNLKYINLLREKARATIETEQDRKAAAHLKALNVVDRVIAQNEIVQVTSLRLLYLQEFEKNN